MCSVTSLIIRHVFASLASNFIFPLAAIQIAKRIWRATAKCLHWARYALFVGSDNGGRRRRSAPASDRHICAPTAFRTPVGQVCLGHLWATCVSDTCGPSAFRISVGQVCLGHLRAKCASDICGPSVHRIYVGQLCAGYLWVKCVSDICGPSVFRTYEDQVCLRHRCDTCV